MQKHQTTGDEQIHRTIEEMKNGDWLKNAQRRSQRRKSLWNLLLPLFALPLWAVFAFGSTDIVWQAHIVFHPEHAGLQREFFAHSLRLNSALMTLPFFLAAIFPAFVVTNYLVYLIPAARRALDNEDRAFPEIGYAPSQRALIKLGILFYAGATILALIGAALNSSFHIAGAA